MWFHKGFNYLKVTGSIFVAGFSSGLLFSATIYHALPYKIFKVEGNTYTPGEPNPDLAKNMLLLKNPQFLPNHCETLSK